MAKNIPTKEQVRQRVADAVIPDDPQIPLDEFQYAKLRGCSVHQARRERWAGGGPPYIKCKGMVRYRRSDIDAFIATRMRTSTSDPGTSTGVPSRSMSNSRPNPDLNHSHKGRIASIAQV